jgi:hypothetical protein
MSLLKSYDIEAHSFCGRAFGLLHKDQVSFPLPQTQLLETPKRNYANIMFPFGAIVISYFDYRVHPTSPFENRTTVP